MGVNYVHLINYMCPYAEGQISFSLSVDLEKKEKVSDFSELCEVIKSFGEEGVEASGYYVSSTDQNDHKQIIKVRCLDGLTIQPIFEEPKSKVLTRSIANTPTSVSVLNAPAVLSDTVNDKFVTLSGLAVFKEKCDSNYKANYELHAFHCQLRQNDTNGYYDCFLNFNISLPLNASISTIEDIFNYLTSNGEANFEIPVSGYVKASLTGDQANYKGIPYSMKFDLENSVFSVQTININNMQELELTNLELTEMTDKIIQAY